jgi:prefoldin alpha subunit
MMEGTVETLNQRLNLLTSANAELRLAKHSLNDLKEIDQKNPLLVPIGGGAFVNADLGDISKVVIGIGADTSIEMDYDEAVQNISERLNEMERAQTSVQQQIVQVIAQLESHQAAVQKLSAEFQGASSV